MVGQFPHLTALDTDDMPVPLGSQAATGTGFREGQVTCHFKAHMPFHAARYGFGTASSPGGEEIEPIITARVGPCQSVH